MSFLKKWFWNIGAQKDNLNDFFLIFLLKLLNLVKLGNVCGEFLRKNKKEYLKQSSKRKLCPS